MKSTLEVPRCVLASAFLLFAGGCGNDGQPMTDGAMESTDGGKLDEASGDGSDGAGSSDDGDADADDDGDGPVGEGDGLPCYAAGADTLRWRIDDSYAHRTQTRALPKFEPANPPDEGVVRIAARDLEFRARIYGWSNGGPNIVMLHGFPSSSLMWEHAAQAAAAAGYRVLAFDQRGYSPDARPEGVESYLVTEFVDDVEALADAVGFERFHLVGHDIGCVVSWVHATLHPDRLESLTCLSVSHPRTLADTIINDPPEYIQLFSLPNVPEAALTANDAAELRRQYAFMNEDECREYNRLFMEEDALRATVDFYRGIADSLMTVEEVIQMPVEVPTLFAYGTGEQWVTDETLAAHPAIITAPYVEHELSDAGPTGHFIVEARREDVTELLLEHFAAYADD